MTIKEFSMHRPYSGALVDLLGDLGDLPWDVTPRYQDGILFVAEAPGQERLVCVGPGHPGHMTGDRATWWWEADLPCGG